MIKSLLAHFLIAITLCLCVHPVCVVMRVFVRSQFIFVARCRAAAAAGGGATVMAAVAADARRVSRRTHRKPTFSGNKLMLAALLSDVT